MKINLWYCSQMEQWRWTLCDDSKETLRQEAGQRPDLHTAMADIADTVEFMLAEAK